MTIEKARKILGKQSEKRNDEEIRAIINMLETLADIAIDNVVNKKQK